MKIILTADIHWGLPNRDEDSLWALNTMEEYGKQNDIEHAFILGDLFHNRLMIDVIGHHKLSNFFKNSSMEWTVFPGNHDLPKKNMWEISTLNSIKEIRLIKDISKFKLGNLIFWVLPFISNENIYMKALKKINKEANESEILLTHIAINSAIRNFCYMDHYGGMIDFSGTKFKRVIAGHFHNRQKIDNFYYVGSPVPFRYDEGLVDHGFMTLDSDYNLEFIDLYDFEGHPPYYLSLTPENIDSANVEGNNVRVIINEYVDQNEIYEKLRKNGAIKIKIEDKTPEKKLLNSAYRGSDLLSISEEYIRQEKFDDVDKELLINLNNQLLEA